MFVLELISFDFRFGVLLSFACCTPLVVYLQVVILAVFVCGSCVVYGWVCLIVVLVFGFVWCVTMVFVVC